MVASLYLLASVGERASISFCDLGSLSSKSAGKVSCRAVVRREDRRQRSGGTLDSRQERSVSRSGL